MQELDVQIVTLEPMRMASAYSFGASPEEQAWSKILAFAGSKSLKANHSRFFGFNNPNPSPASPNYGYEQWMTVPPEVEPEGDIRIIEFKGGLYAVTRCQGISHIGQDWQKMVLWLEDSPYQRGHHQWLEELLTSPSVPFEEYVFDLFLPISAH